MRILAIERYIDVNLIDESSSTALHYACYCGNIDAAKILINERSNDINLNIQNKYGKTILHYACGKGYLDILKLIVKSGNIGVDIKTNKGITALQYAVVAGHTEIIENLTYYTNLDILIKDNFGNTAFQHAWQTKQWKVILLLVRKVIAMSFVKYTYYYILAFITFIVILFFMGKFLFF